jgi:calreticulin
MIYKTVGITFLSLLSAIQGKIYFKEDFNDASWSKRWVTSDMGGKPAGELGEFKHTAGEHFGDAADKGIQTSEDARFYGLSAKMDSSFTNTNKELVVQMSVKHEQDLDCGGAYIKLLGPEVDQEKFGGETPYHVMFGPDICGGGTRKTHVIFGYDKTHSNGERKNVESKKSMTCETDEVTHLYTLIVKSDLPSICTS